MLLPVCVPGAAECGHCLVEGVGYSDLGPLPQLPAGAAHAVHAADSVAVVADFVIIRAGLVVEKDNVRERERGSWLAAAS